MPQDTADGHRWRRDFNWGTAFEFRKQRRFSSPDESRNTGLFILCSSFICVHSSVINFSPVALFRLKPPAPGIVQNSVAAKVTRLKLKKNIRKPGEWVLGETAFDGYKIVAFPRGDDWKFSLVSSVLLSRDSRDPRFDSIVCGQARRAFFFAGFRPKTALKKKSKKC